ncbi:nuclear transport factor 2 family protein [Aliiroseovarius sp. 2305UL8-7]|uniref:nuclear transport factor 2 family protein n=1 Tax=Aliiroseovarius conchicola TaxID=3121637 RepID=UPI003529A106
MEKTLTTLSAIALSTSAALADVETNKATAVAAMNDVLVNLDASRIDTYFADPYIQHNPVAGSGVDALRGLVEHAKQGLGFELETVRMIGASDMVVMHNVWEGFGPTPMVAFDVFRFNEDGKIVEHWDNLQPVADKPNPSGRTQIDGGTEITDLDATTKNKELVEDFVTRVLIDGEKVDFSNYINPEKYLQHNTAAGDGLDGLGAFLAHLAENDIAFYYSDLAIIVAEGNYVFTASKGVFGDQPTAYFDLFRLEDGRIVEHWDVIADMPSGDLPRGYPGKF